MSGGDGKHHEKPGVKPAPKAGAEHHPAHHDGHGDHHVEPHAGQAHEQQQHTSRVITTDHRANVTARRASEQEAHRSADSHLPHVELAGRKPETAHGQPQDHHLGKHPESLTPKERHEKGIKDYTDPKTHKHYKYDNHGRLTDVEAPSGRHTHIDYQGDTTQPKHCEISQHPPINTVFRGDHDDKHHLKVDQSTGEITYTYQDKRPVEKNGKTVEEPVTVQSHYNSDGTSSKITSDMHGHRLTKEIDIPGANASVIKIGQYNYQYYDAQGMPATPDKGSFSTVEQTDAQGKPIHEFQFRNQSDLQSWRPAMREDITRKQVGDTETEHHAVYALSGKQEKLESTTDTSVDKVDGHIHQEQHDFSTGKDQLVSSMDKTVNQQTGETILHQQKYEHGKLVSDQEMSYDGDGHPTRYHYKDTKNHYDLTFSFKDGKAIGVTDAHRTLTQEEQQHLTAFAQHNLEVTAASCGIHAFNPAEAGDNLGPTPPRQGHESTGTLAWKESDGYAQGYVDKGIIYDHKGGKAIGKFQDNGEVNLDGPPPTSFNVANDNKECAVFHGLGTDHHRLDLCAGQTDHKEGLNGVFANSAKPPETYQAIGGNVFDKGGKFIGHVNPQGQIEFDQHAMPGEQPKDLNSWLGQGSWKFEGNENGQIRQFSFSENQPLCNSKTPLLLPDIDPQTGKQRLDGSGKPQAVACTVEMGMVIGPDGKERGQFVPPQLGTDGKLTGGGIITGNPPQEIPLQNFKGAVFNVEVLGKSGQHETIQGAALGRGSTADGSDGGLVNFAQLQDRYNQQVQSAEQGVQNTKDSVSWWSGQRNQSIEAAQYQVQLRTQQASQANQQIQDILNGKVPFDDATAGNLNLRMSQTEAAALGDGLERTRKELDAPNYRLEDLPPDISKLHGSLKLSDPSAPGGVAEYDIRPTPARDAQGKPLLDQHNQPVMVAGIFKKGTNTQAGSINSSDGSITWQAKNSQGQLVDVQERMSDLKGAVWHLEFPGANNQTQKLDWITGPNHKIYSVAQLRAQAHAETNYASAFNDANNPQHKPDEMSQLALARSQANEANFNKELDNIIKNGIPDTDNAAQAGSPKLDAALTQVIEGPQKTVRAELFRDKDRPQPKQISIPDLNDENLGKMHGLMRVGNDQFMIVPTPKKDAHGKPVTNSKGEPVMEAGLYRFHYVIVNGQEERVPDSQPCGQLEQGYMANIDGHEVSLAQANHVTMKFKIDGDNREHRILGLGPTHTGPDGHPLPGGLVEADELIRQAKEAQNQAISGNAEYFSNMPYLIGGTTDWALGNRGAQMQQIQEQMSHQTQALNREFDQMFNEGLSSKHVDNNQLDDDLRATQNFMRDLNLSASDTQMLSTTGQQMQKQAADAAAMAVTTVLTAGAGAAISAGFEALEVTTTTTMVVGSEMIAGSAIGGISSLALRTTQGGVRELSNVRNMGELFHSQAYENLSSGAMEGMTMAFGSSMGNVMKEFSIATKLAAEGKALTVAQQALLESRAAQAMVRFMARGGNYMRAAEFGLSGMQRVGNAFVQTVGFNTAGGIREGNMMQDLSTSQMMQGAMFMMAAEFAGEGFSGERGWIEAGNEGLGRLGERCGISRLGRSLSESRLGQAFAESRATRFLSNTLERSEAAAAFKNALQRIPSDTINAFTNSALGAQTSAWENERERLAEELHVPKDAISDDYLYAHGDRERVFNYIIQSGVEGAVTAPFMTVMSSPVHTWAEGVHSSHTYHAESFMDASTGVETTVIRHGDNETLSSQPDGTWAASSPDGETIPFDGIVEQSGQNHQGRPEFRVVDSYGTRESLGDGTVRVTPHDAKDPTYHLDVYGRVAQVEDGSHNRVTVSYNEFRPTEISELRTSGGDVYQNNGEHWTHKTAGKTEPVSASEVASLLDRVSAGRDTGLSVHEHNGQVSIDSESRGLLPSSVAGVQTARTELSAAEHALQQGSGSQVEVDRARHALEQANTRLEADNRIAGARRAAQERDHEAQQRITQAQTRLQHALGQAQEGNGNPVELAEAHAELEVAQSRRANDVELSSRELNATLAEARAQQEPNSTEAQTSLANARAELEQSQAKAHGELREAKARAQLEVVEANNNQSIRQSEVESRRRVAEADSEYQRAQKEARQDPEDKDRQRSLARAEANRERVESQATSEVDTAQMRAKLRTTQAENQVMQARVEADSERNIARADANRIRVEAEAQESIAQSQREGEASVRQAQSQVQAASQQNDPALLHRAEAELHSAQVKAKGESEIAESTARLKTVEAENMVTQARVEAETQRNVAEAEANRSLVETRNRANLTRVEHETRQAVEQAERRLSTAREKGEATAIKEAQATVVRARERSAAEGERARSQAQQRSTDAENRVRLAQVEAESRRTQTRVEGELREATARVESENSRQLARHRETLAQAEARASEHPENPIAQRQVQQATEELESVRQDAHNRLELARVTEDGGRDIAEAETRLTTAAEQARQSPNDPQAQLAKTKLAGDLNVARVEADEKVEVAKRQGQFESAALQLKQAEARLKHAEEHPRTGEPADQERQELSALTTAVESAKTAQEEAREQLGQANVKAQQSIARAREAASHSLRQEEQAWKVTYSPRSSTEAPREEAPRPNSSVTRPRVQASARDSVDSTPDTTGEMLVMGPDGKMIRVGSTAQVLMRLAEHAARLEETARDLTKLKTKEEREKQLRQLLDVIQQNMNALNISDLALAKLQGKISEAFQRFAYLIADFHPGNEGDIEAAVATLRQVVEEAQAAAQQNEEARGRQEKPSAGEPALPDITDDQSQRLEPGEGTGAREVSEANTLGQVSSRSQEIVSAEDQVLPETELGEAASSQESGDARPDDLRQPSLDFTPLNDESRLQDLLSMLDRPDQMNAESIRELLHQLDQNPLLIMKKVSDRAIREQKLKLLAEDNGLKQVLKDEIERQQKRAELLSRGIARETVDRLRPDQDNNQQQLVTARNALLEIIRARYQAAEPADQELLASYMENLFLKAGGTTTTYVNAAGMSRVLEELSSRTEPTPITQEQQELVMRLETVITSRDAWSLNRPDESRIAEKREEIRIILAGLTSPVEIPERSFAEHPTMPNNQQPEMNAARESLEQALMAAHADLASEHHVQVNRSVEAAQETWQHVRAQLEATEQRLQAQSGKQKVREDVLERVRQRKADVERESNILLQAKDNAKSQQEKLEQQVSMLAELQKQFTEPTSLESLNSLTADIAKQRRRLTNALAAAARHADLLTKQAQAVESMSLEELSTPPPRAHHGRMEVRSEQGVKVPIGSLDFECTVRRCGLDGKEYELYLDGCFAHNVLPILQRSNSNVKVRIETIGGAADLATLQETLFPILAKDFPGIGWKTLDPARWSNPQELENAFQTLSGKEQDAKAFTIYAQTPEEALTIAARLDAALKEHPELAIKSPHSDNCDELYGESGRVAIACDWLPVATRGFVTSSPIARLNDVLLDAIQHFPEHERSMSTASAEEAIVRDQFRTLITSGDLIELDDQGRLIGMKTEGLRQLESILGIRTGLLSYNEGMFAINTWVPAENLVDPHRKRVYLSEVGAERHRRGTKRSVQTEQGNIEETSLGCTGRFAVYAIYKAFGMSPVKATAGRESFVLRNAQGKEVYRNNGQTKEWLYDNGVRDSVGDDGVYKRITPDGQHLQWEPQTNTWTLRERHYDNGVKDILGEDGALRRVMPDGQQWLWDPRNHTWLSQDASSTPAHPTEGQELVPSSARPPVDLAPSPAVAAQSTLHDPARTTPAASPAGKTTRAMARKGLQQAEAPGSEATYHILDVPESLRLRQTYEGPDFSRLGRSNQGDRVLREKHLAIEGVPFDHVFLTPDIRYEFNQHLKSVTSHFEDISHLAKEERRARENNDISRADELREEIVAHLTERAEVLNNAINQFARERNLPSLILNVLPDTVVSEMGCVASHRAYDNAVILPESYLLNFENLHEGNVLHEVFHSEQVNQVGWSIVHEMMGLRGTDRFTEVTPENLRERFFEKLGLNLDDFLAEIDDPDLRQAHLQNIDAYLQEVIDSARKRPPMSPQELQQQLLRADALAKSFRESNKQQERLSAIDRQSRTLMDRYYQQVSNPQHNPRAMLEALVSDPVFAKDLLGIELSRLPKRITEPIKEAVNHQSSSPEQSAAAFKALVEEALDRNERRYQKTYLSSRHELEANLVGDRMAASSKSQEAEDRDGGVEAASMFSTQANLPSTPSPHTHEPGSLIDVMDSAVNQRAPRDFTPDAHREAMRSVLESWKEYYLQSDPNLTTALEQMERALDTMPPHLLGRIRHIVEILGERHPGEVLKILSEAAIQGGRIQPTDESLRYLHSFLNAVKRSTERGSQEFLQLQALERALESPTLNLPGLGGNLPISRLYGPGLLRARKGSANLARESSRGPAERQSSEADSTQINRHPTGVEAPDTSSPKSAEYTGAHDGPEANVPREPSMYDGLADPERRILNLLSVKAGFKGDGIRHIGQLSYEELVPAIDGVLRRDRGADRTLFEESLRDSALKAKGGVKAYKAVVNDLIRAVESRLMDGDYPAEQLTPTAIDRLLQLAEEADRVLDKPKRPKSSKSNDLDWPTRLQVNLIGTISAEALAGLEYSLILALTAPEVLTRALNSLRNNPPGQQSFIEKLTSAYQRLQYTEAFLSNDHNRTVPLIKAWSDFEKLLVSNHLEVPSRLRRMLPQAGQRELSITERFKHDILFGVGQLTKGSPDNQRLEQLARDIDQILSKQEIQPQDKTALSSLKGAQVLLENLQPAERQSAESWRAEAEMTLALVKKALEGQFDLIPDGTTTADGAPVNQYNPSEYGDCCVAATISSFLNHVISRQAALNLVTRLNTNSSFEVRKIPLDSHGRPVITAAHVMAITGNVRAGGIIDPMWVSSDRFDETNPRHLNRDDYQSLSAGERDVIFQERQIELAKAHIPKAIDRLLQVAGEGKVSVIDPELSSDFDFTFTLDGCHASSAVNGVPYEPLWSHLPPTDAINTMSRNTRRRAVTSNAHLHYSTADVQRYYSSAKPGLADSALLDPEPINASPPSATPGATTVNMAADHEPEPGEELPGTVNESSIEAPPANPQDGREPENILRDSTGRPLSDGNSDRVAKHFEQLSPGEMTVSLAELSRDLSEYKGSRSQSILDKLKASSLHPEQVERVLGVLSEIREGYLSRRTKDGGVDPEQKGSYLHTLGEMSEGLDCARAKNMPPERAELALLAAMLTDSYKSGWKKGWGGNFFTHHLDGALAAEAVLKRYHFNEQDIDHIRHAILEHQIGPPGFMSVAYTGEIRTGLTEIEKLLGTPLTNLSEEDFQRLYAAEPPLNPADLSRVQSIHKLKSYFDGQQNAVQAEIEELETIPPEHQTAEQQQLLSQLRLRLLEPSIFRGNAPAMISEIQTRMSNPFNAPLETDDIRGGKRIAYSHEQRELLTTFVDEGAENWHVPEDTNPWNDISRVVISADSFDNYFPLQAEDGEPLKGPFKIAGLRGPKSLSTPDKTLSDAIAAISQSADESISLMTPDEQARARERLERSKAVYAELTEAIEKHFRERLEREGRIKPGDPIPYLNTKLETLKPEPGTQQELDFNLAAEIHQYFVDELLAMRRRLPPRVPEPKAFEPVRGRTEQELSERALLAGMQQTIAEASAPASLRSQRPGAATGFSVPSRPPEAYRSPRGDADQEEIPEPHPTAAEVVLDEAGNPREITAANGPRAKAAPLPERPYDEVEQLQNSFENSGAPLIDRLDALHGLLEAVRVTMPSDRQRTAMYFEGLSALMNELRESWDTADLSEVDRQYAQLLSDISAHQWTGPRSLAVNDSLKKRVTRVYAAKLNSRMLKT